MVYIVVVNGILSAAKCEIDPLVQIVGDIGAFESLLVLYQEILSIFGPGWKLHVIDTLTIHSHSKV